MKKILIIIIMSISFFVVIITLIEIFDAFNNLNTYPFSSLNSTIKYKSLNNLVIWDSFQIIFHSIILLFGFKNLRHSRSKIYFFVAVTMFLIAFIYFIINYYLWYKSGFDIRL